MTHSIISSMQSYLPGSFQNIGREVPAIAQIQELLANPLKGGAKIFVSQITKAVEMIPGYNTSPLAQELKENIALIQAYPEAFAISAGAAWAGIKGVQTSTVLTNATLISNLTGTLPYLVYPFASAISPLTGLNVKNFVKAVNESDPYIKAYFLTKPAAMAAGDWASEALDALLALNVGAQYVKNLAALDEVVKEFEVLEFEGYIAEYNLEESDSFFTFDNGSAVLNTEKEFAILEWVTEPDKSGEEYFVDCREGQELLTSEMSEALFSSFTAEEAANTM